MYPGTEDPRLRGAKATGMSEGVPADGGYLVPETMAAGIIDDMLEEGSILSRISLDNVTGNAMTYNGVDEIHPQSEACTAGWSATGWARAEPEPHPSRSFTRSR